MHPPRYRRRSLPTRPSPAPSKPSRRFTTEARTSIHGSRYVPESATVPSPSDFLGHVAGAAGELTNTTQIYGYFRALDKASDACAWR